jgi:hypothetical protein
MEYFCSHTKCRGKVWGTDRHDHEFLYIDIVVGMGTTVQDVHHRKRQFPGVYAANIAVEGQTECLCRSLGNSDGNTEDRICPEITFEFSPVQFDHAQIYAGLIGCVHPDDLIRDLGVHIVDCGENSFSQVSSGVAVSQFQGFPLTRGGSRWYGCPAHYPGLQQYFYFQSRVASRIENLPCIHISNCAHLLSPLLRGICP